MPVPIWAGIMPVPSVRTPVPTAVVGLTAVKEPVIMPCAGMVPVQALSLNSAFQTLVFGVLMH